MEPNKTKYNNWLLVGALFFFLTALGFTTANSTQLEPELCYICSLSGCEQSAPGQNGAVWCADELGGNDDCDLNFACYPTIPEKEEEG